MRKRRLIIIISIFIITLLSACNSSSNIDKLHIPAAGQGTPHKVKYIVDINEKSTVNKLMVYKFVPVTNPKEKALELKNMFGFESNLKDISNKLICKDNDSKTDFTYEKDTGKWSYYNNYVNDVTKIVSVPNEKECIEIAKLFLENNKIIENSSKYHIVTSETTTGSVLTNDFRIIGRNIYFSPIVNGKPVLGVSRIIVSIGDKGEITSVCNYCKKFVEYKEIDIIDQDEAFRMFQNGEGSSNIDSMAEEVIFHEAELYYWADAGTIDDQAYLQPVWVFKGRVNGEEVINKTCDVIIAAIQ